MTRTKGIVLSRGEGRAVILTPAGEYRSIKIHAPLEVGELYDDGASRPWWRYALAAAVILAMTLGTIDFYSVKAYAQVSDAVELGLNRWGRVVTTRALNEEGAQILENTNFKGQKIETAVEEITFQTGTDPDPGKAQELKVFPPQAAEKGNKDDAFLNKIETNMNQGYNRALEKTENTAPNENSNKIPGKQKSKSE